MLTDAKWKRVLIVAVIAVIVPVCCITAVALNLIPPCPYKEFFGLDCITCGTTRMIKAIFIGDFNQAFRFNPAIFIITPFAFIFTVFEAVAFIRGKTNVLRKIIPFWVYIVVLVLLLAFGIIRNIPIFSFLAPTIV